MSAARSPSHETPLSVLPPDVATGMLISTAHRRCQKIFNEALQPLGIEERHFATLAVLDSAGPVTQRQLADLLDLDKSSLGRIIDELERRHLAQRKAVPDDRRARAIHLTDRGRERVDEAQRIASHVGHRLFGHLTPRTRRALDQGLQQVLRAPRTNDDQAAPPTP